jgi:hypothetical protein
MLLGQTGRMGYHLRVEIRKDVYFTHNAKERAV